MVSPQIQQRIRGKKLKKSTLCQLCNVDFGARQKFTQHVRGEANHSLTQCQCDGCNIFAKVLFAGKTRIFRANLPEPKTIECEACGESFILCTIGVTTHSKQKPHLRNAHIKNLTCNDAGVSFLTRSDYNEHMREMHDKDSANIECMTCGKTFANACLESSHIRDNKWHSPTQRPPVCCEPCGRIFTNEEQLQEHKDSKSHRPLHCIGSRCCKRRYKTYSAMVQHLESSACVSGWNRLRIDAALEEHDVEHIITRPAGHMLNAKQAQAVIDLAIRPLAGVPTKRTDDDDIGDDTDSDVGVPVILTPLSTPPRSRCNSANVSASGVSSTDDGGVGVLTPAGESDVEDVVDFRCDKCPRRFASMEALQTHIDGVAHAAKIYACPTGLLEKLMVDKGLSTEIGNKGKGKGKGAVKMFKVLSGLVAHLESGACVGGKEAVGLVMERVVRYVQERMRIMGIENCRILEV